MPTTQFYDKAGKVNIYQGDESSFDKWNTFGFTKTSPVTPPGTAGIAEMSTVGSPAIDNRAGTMTASGAGAITYGTNTIEGLQKRLDELANQKPSTETTTEKKSIMDLISKREETKANQKSVTELRTEAINQAYTEMGVTPEQIQKIGGLIGEVTEYNKQIADLEAKKQSALDNAQTAGVTTGFYGLEQNSITKKFNSEISAKALQAGVKVQELQMIQGAYDDAKTTASQLVELATYDQQQEVADIEWSLGAHQDLYNLMDKEEQTQWDRQYTTAKDSLETLKAEKTAISEIMTTPELSGAGVTINDTLEQANAKVAKYVGTSAYLNRVAQIENIGKVTDSWTSPYTLNGATVQRNNTTGEIRTISGTSTTPVTNIEGELPNLNDYKWNNTSLNQLTAPFSPYQRTALAYEKEAILAFAYASSGKQMSWNEAQQLYAAYIPNIFDSNETKINKLLSLDSAINQVSSSAGDKATQTQSNIAKQKINQLKQELKIEKINSSDGNTTSNSWKSPSGNNYNLPY
jgi:hypothetical protein